MHCNHIFLYSEVITAAVICVHVGQVLGAGCICFTLPAGTDVVVWLVLPERVVRGDGVSLHHLQHPAGDVHLHLPLSPSKESKHNNGG